MTRPPPLGDDLDRLFTDELSHCRGMLVTSDDERSFAPADELLSPDALDAVLGRFARARGDGADRRAVASLWTQWYFGTLVPPSVAASERLGRVLPLGIGEIDVRLDDDTGRPLAFRLPGEGGIDRDASPFRRYHALVREHLAPIVEAVAPRVGLSADTVWTNAGRYLQWIVDVLDRSSDADHPAAGRALLEAEAWPDGWENPLHDCIRYVDRGGRRVARRRVCCLQYLIPGMDGCGGLCPLPHVRGETGESG